MGGETRVVKCHCDDFVQVFVEDGLRMSVTIILYCEQIFTIYLLTKLFIKKQLYMLNEMHCEKGKL